MTIVKIAIKRHSLTTGREIKIGKSAWLVLAATSLANFLVGLDMSIASVAFPALIAAFPESSTADLSWILTFYSVTLAGFLIVAGRIADRVGRLKVFNLGMALFVAASVGVAAAPTVSIMIVMRGVQGLAAAMMTPASLGLVIAAWPAERRTTAVAAWSSVLALASSIGPLLGGFIIELTSWRWAFLLNVPIGMFALIWGRKVLTETERDKNAASPDLVGAVLTIIATSGILLAIVQGPEWGWTSYQLIALVLFVAMICAALVWHTMSHNDPIMPPILFSIPTFRIASVALFIFSLGFLSTFVTLMLFLTSVWGYSVFEAGFAVTGVPVMAAITANVAGRLAERVGFRAIIVPGCVAFAVGALWMWLLIGPQPDPFVVLFPATILMGIGIGAAPAILNGAAVAAVEPAYFSVAGAVGQTARQLGTAIGVALLVVIIGYPEDLVSSLAAFERAFLYLAVVTGLAGLAAMALRNAR